MSLNIIIISTGTEITSGKSLDTNSMWIANQLTDSGYTVSKFMALPDSVIQLKTEISSFSQSKEPTLLLMTGGLGATDDDHTLNIISELKGGGLRKIESAYQKLVSISEKRGKEFMDLLPVTSRQTNVPIDSTELENTVGIAPGFYVKLGENCALAAMPGVPLEMKKMFLDSLLPIIKKEYIITSTKYLSKYIWNMSEGLYQREFINKNIEYINSNQIEWGVTAKAGYIKVSFKSNSNEKLESIESLLEKSYNEKLTDDIFKLVHELLTNRKETVSTAESCTGGYIGKILTDSPGSSAYYLGSIVSYHNSIKESLLNVKHDTLEKFGAVSEETASEMLIGLEKLINTHYSISVTGIAGPNGGSIDKPVGTVFIGIKTRNKAEKIYKHLFSIGRESFREAVTGMAIYYLYREILENIEYGKK
jgi:nicotinamide-nucleotide amidase